MKYYGNDDYPFDHFIDVYDENNKDINMEIDRFFKRISKIFFYLDKNISDIENEYINLIKLLEDNKLFTNDNELTNANINEGILAIKLIISKTYDNLLDLENSKK